MPAKKYFINQEMWTVKKLARANGISEDRARRKLALHAKGEMTTKVLFAKCEALKSSRTKGKKNRWCCNRGDVVWFEGRQVYVQQVLEKGSKNDFKKAYIKCCPFKAIEKVALRSWADRKGNGKVAQHPLWHILQVGSRAQAGAGHSVQVH